MRYTAYIRLSEPARASAELWRLVAGVVLIFGLYQVMSLAYFKMLAELVTHDEWPLLAYETSLGITPRGMMVVFGTFGFALLSLFIVIHQLHGRQLRSLIGPPDRALRDITRVSIGLAGLSVLMWLLPEPMLLQPEPNMGIMRWLALLPLALPLLIMQVSTEELLFRGYIQSQLAARLSHPAIWMILPSVLFGMLHYDSAMAGANAPYIALSATLFGIAAADLTARAGNLGPAIALHFFVNFSAIMVTAPQGYLNGLALGTYGFAMNDAATRPVWLPYDLLILLCSWLTARLAISR